MTLRNLVLTILLSAPPAGAQLPNSELPKTIPVLRSDPHRLCPSDSAVSEANQLPANSLDVFILQVMSTYRIPGVSACAFHDGQIMADGAPESVLADPEVRRTVLGKV